MGIPVLPPDINRSEDHFTVEGDAIRFGLGAVKNVGHGLIRSVSRKRGEGGPFKSLEDFLQRMGEGELNKRAVENFIKCGAMDCFGNHRSELLAVYDSMMDSVSATRKHNLDGQMGLFGMLEEDTSTAIPIPKMPELKKADLMAMEKETTGIYLSGHPMDDYRKYLLNTHVVPMAKLMDEESNYEDDQIVSVAGIVQSMKMKTTRNNSMMAYVTVEDDTASMEMLAFSNVLSQYGSYLSENAAVVITGRLSMREDKDPQIVINRVRPMTDYSEQPQAVPQNEPVHRPAPVNGTLWLKLSGEADPRYNKVRAIVNMFPGNSDVRVFFADTRKVRGAKAALDGRMLAELENVLGKENVVVK